MIFIAIGSVVIAAAIALWRLTRNRRWQWKLLGRVAAGILVCASALALLLFLFGAIACGRYEFTPVSTLGGKFAAQVSEEDCGAVDSFHTSVQLWRNRQGLPARLFGKRGYSTAVFTIGHDPRLIDLSWKDDQTLLIRYPNDSRDLGEFHCQPQWEGVRVECVGYSPDYSKPVGKMPPGQRCVWSLQSCVW